jgi:hypothetical protein
METKEIYSGFGFKEVSTSELEGMNVISATVDGEEAIIDLDDNDLILAVDTGNYFTSSDGLYFTEDTEEYYEERWDLYETYDTDRMFKHSDDLYYTEDTGRWFEHSDILYHIEYNGWYEDSPSIGLAAYHEGRTNDNRVLEDESIMARVGYEAEKEDYNIRGDYSHDDCYEYNFRKEEDCSLDDDSGFEFISGVYDLHGDKIFEDMEIPLVKAHLNANWSPNCGGHISYSRRDVSPGVLLDKYLNGYIPLLMAMYTHRLNHSYSQAKAKPYIRDCRGAFSVEAHRVEIRIFPAIKNVKNLQWRINLLRYIDKNPRQSPIRVIREASTKGSELNNLLREVYSESVLKERFILALALGASLGYARVGRKELADKISLIQTDAAKRVARCISRETEDHSMEITKFKYNI